MNRDCEYEWNVANEQKMRCFGSRLNVESATDYVSFSCLSELCT